MSDADSPRDFVERLRREGALRYHDRHPFNVRMHEGKLNRVELGSWVLNRYYYQTRIPIKDAIILSKSDEVGGSARAAAWRRSWIHRVVDHDGTEEGEGGLALWLRLAEAVGLERGEVESLSRVLPGVRFACDAYVQFVKDRTLLEAVASSLTEAFAPDIMSRRIVAWEQHYPWVDKTALDYFRSRVPRARRDSEEAVLFVTEHATTRALQDRCVAALVTKCEILWSLLDGVAAGATLPPIAT